LEFGVISPFTFDIQVILSQQGLQKVTSSLDFHSTHIVGPLAIRYHKQFGQLLTLVDLAHGLEMPITIAFQNKGQFDMFELKILL
jgi:hypothetical protein